MDGTTDTALSLSISAPLQGSKREKEKREGPIRMKNSEGDRQLKVHCFSPQQVARLEESFSESTLLNMRTTSSLSKELGVAPLQNPREEEKSSGLQQKSVGSNQPSKNKCFKPEKIQHLKEAFRKCTKPTGTVRSDLSKELGMTDQ